MKTSVNWIDVTNHLATGQQPVVMLERPLLYGDDPRGPGFRVAQVARVGHFWAPQGPLVGDAPQWALTREGQYVRVPVFAYRTAHRAASAILATGLEIGMAAVDTLRQYTGERPEEVTLVLGHECTDMPAESCFRCYVGVCIRTAK